MGRERGLTVIELMIVMAIVVVVGAILAQEIALRGKTVEGGSAPSYSASQEVTLENKKTGSTLWAFCERGNRVYVHIRFDDADLWVVPGGCER